jgi:hypothetical protein
MWAISQQIYVANLQIPPTTNRREPQWPPAGAWPALSRHKPAATRREQHQQRSRRGLSSSGSSPRDPPPLSQVLNQIFCWSLSFNCFLWTWDLGKSFSVHLLLQPIFWLFSLNLWYGQFPFPYMDAATQIYSDFHDLDPYMDAVIFLHLVSRTNVSLICSYENFLTLC